MSFFQKLKQGLSKTKDTISGRIDDVIKSFRKVDEDLFEELEEVLIAADVGVNTSMEIMDRLRDAVKTKKIDDPEQVKQELIDIIVELMDSGEQKFSIDTKPTVVMVIGVNGAGKTTTIGKMANFLKAEGNHVIVAAADTFRAAAIEQLEVWTERAGVELIKHQEGADPGAVVFDACSAAKSRGCDVLICDTAGRLHNKVNLMNELNKIFRIIKKELPDAKCEVLLVLDATTGQNALSQAKLFADTAEITGIVLTKIDGTAKGGVTIAIKAEQNIPVKFIGVGEGIDDLSYFDSREFVKALFDSEEA